MPADTIYIKQVIWIESIGIMVCSPLGAVKAL